MGMRDVASEIKAAVTEYICVLCGSVWNSEEYHWGTCADVSAGSVVRRCDWSCPQCGGVVVEYARRPARMSEGESALARPHA
jgi:hypothetical protein